MLVGVLAVVVLVGTVAMWVDYRARVDEATSGLASDPGPSPSRPASAGSPPTATPREPAEPVEPAEVSSLWIGDGYTRTACDVADLLGWACTVDAQQGTGFLSDGSSFDADFATLGDRVDDLPRRAPDVVVVDAGRNDIGVYATAPMIEAMGEVLEQLRERYPDAALVQIVPWTTQIPRSDPALVGAVEDLMATYDGQVVAATGEPLTGALLADRLRALDLPGVPAEQ